LAQDFKTLSYLLYAGIKNEQHQILLT